MVILPTIGKDKNPCYSCKERRIGCHSKCDKYRIFREELAKFRKEQKKYGNYRAEQTINIYSSGYNTSKNGKKSSLYSMSRNNNKPR